MTTATPTATSTSSGQANTIDTVTEQLKSEEVKLKEQLHQHQQQVATIQADLERLQSALSALTSNGKKQQQRKQKRPNTKPSATQSEVNQAIAHALASHTALTADEITQQVEQATTKQGKSRVGLSLRIKQALNDDAIEQQSNGTYRLKPFDSAPAFAPVGATTGRQGKQPNGTFTPQT